MHPSMKRLLDYAKEATKGDAASVADFADIGARLGESSATLTNWKARGVSKDGAIKAESVFGCSVHWILTGEQPPGKPMLQLELSRNELNALTLFRDVPENVREPFLACANALATLDPGDVEHTAAMAQLLVDIAEAPADKRLAATMAAVGAVAMVRYNTFTRRSELERPARGVTPTPAPSADPQTLPLKVPAPTPAHKS